MAGRAPIMLRVLTGRERARYPEEGVSLSGLGPVWSATQASWRRVVSDKKDEMFLTGLNAVIVPLECPAEITAELTRMLGERLEASRAYYME